MTNLSVNESSPKNYLSLIVQGKSYLDGQWVPAKSGDLFDVINPSSNEFIANVANMGEQDALDAIIYAKQALVPWKAMTAKERSVLLKKWYDLILENKEELSHLLTLEQGKPLKESSSEILYGASFVEFYAEEAKRIYGDIVPTHKADARVLVTKEPVGIVAAITPWNFPNAMVTRKVAPALAAGCTVILKPAEDTPLSALALAMLADKAGIPKGVINIITCDRENAPNVGSILATHQDIRKISFTGSTEVGKLLMRHASNNVKKVSLELGGNAPFIVFESADIDAAVDGAISCKFRNSGQTCVCANRIYVQDKIYDLFCEKFTQKVSELKLGCGNSNGLYDLGPLINEKAIKKVDSHVKDAVSKGAEIVYGGNQVDDSLFYQPTVLKNVKDEMLLKQEETFGPVAGIFSFSSEEEVITRANDTNYGLAAYFYSKDYAQCFRVSEALEYGMVAVNEPTVSGEAVPFGGIKESGIGREGSKYGIEEFIEIKYTLMGGIT